MANLRISDLDQALLSQLRARAVRHGVSMEEEARYILHMALAAEPEGETGATLVADTRAMVDQLGGVELALPVRAPPDFSDTGD